MIYLDRNGDILPQTLQRGGAVYEAIRRWVESPGSVSSEEAYRSLAVELAPLVKEYDPWAVDWYMICQRSMAVCRGAGAPEDATLPEACEWLARELHGPSLQPPRPTGDPPGWRQLGVALHAVSDRIHLWAHAIVGDEDWRARNG